MPHLRLAVPGDPRAHDTLGVELYTSGQLDEALEQLARWSSGAAAAALPEARRAVELRPGDEESRHLLEMVPGAREPSPGAAPR